MNTASVVDTDTIAHTAPSSETARLSDAELVARVKQLAQGERDATVALIAHLAELDARRLHLAEGYASTFVYCTQVLRLSEHAAYNRIEAARAARAFPLILERLAVGSVTLTTVRLLAPHLTADNHRDLLDAARGATKREVEELVARLRPQPPVPDMVRKLPTPVSLVDELAGLLAAAQGPDDRATPPPAPAADLVSSPPRPAAVTPLAPERYRVQFTADAALQAKLRHAQALLRHQIPTGDLAQIFDRALTALLRDLIKQKAAATERPRDRSMVPSSRVEGNADRRTTATTGSRHIPAAIKRAVWARDGGRCAFVAADGRCCDEAAFVEYHHVVPYAHGGPATTDNIELRCRAHNGYEAERDFGPRAASDRHDAGNSFRNEPP